MKYRSRKMIFVRVMLMSRNGREPLFSNSCVNWILVLRNMYFVSLYVAIRGRLISIVPFKFICQCQLKPPSESRCYLYS